MEVIREMKTRSQVLLFEYTLPGFRMHAAGRREYPDGQCPGLGAADRHWVNVNKTNGLVVEQNGTCGFLVNGKAKWSGTCRWETPSARGGILDLNTPCLCSPGTFAGA
jgi:hypothetical protein